MEVILTIDFIILIIIIYFLFFREKDNSNNDYTSKSTNNSKKIESKKKNIDSSMNFSKKDYTKKTNKNKEENKIQNNKVMVEFIKDLNVTVSNMPVELFKKGDKREMTLREDGSLDFLYGDEVFFFYDGVEVKIISNDVESNGNKKTEDKKKNYKETFKNKIQNNEVMVKFIKDLEAEVSNMTVEFRKGDKREMTLREDGNLDFSIGDEDFFFYDGADVKIISNDNDVESDGNKKTEDKNNKKDNYKEALKNNKNKNIFKNTKFKNLYTKVVGVTYNNRQYIIKNHLQINQKLDLIREVNNKYDKNAVAVYAGKEQIGYIKKELAKDLASLIDSGKKLECRVKKITGGGSYSYGVNIGLNEISNKKNGKKLDREFTNESAEKIFNKNKYFDIYLGDNGVKRLDEIIYLHTNNQINNKEAENYVDELILEFPKSPQLIISKSLFKDVKYIGDKIFLWKKAIELDPDFIDGYRRLAQGTIALAWKINSRNSTSAERAKLNFKILEIINVIQKNINNLPQYLIENPELYLDNWKDRYQEGVSIFEKGLNSVNKDRYPETFINDINQEYNYLKLGLNEESQAKFWIWNFNKKLM